VRGRGQKHGFLSPEESGKLLNFSVPWFLLNFSNPPFLYLPQKMTAPPPHIREEQLRKDFI
jgi:hypothetical protein